MGCRNMGLPRGGLGRNRSGVRRVGLVSRPEGGGRMGADRRTAGLAVVAVAALTAAVAPAQVSAAIRGPCSATLKGRSVAHLTLAPADAIHVHLGARVVMTMAAQERMTHYRITLTFAGRTWTIKDRDITAHSWADSVQTKRYAQFGRGFYLVRGTSTEPGLTCSGEALVKVG